MTKLDVDQQKNMRDAMTDDWIDTVVAPQVPRREGCATITVRCKTCHKDAADNAFQGQRTSQSTTGDHCHDPCMGAKVRTEAPVLSRRGRSLNLTTVAQNRLKLRKGDVKNACLQGQDTVQDVELETNLSHCL